MRTVSGDQAKHQRDERCTAGLTEQASRAQHAARTAAAVARCRGDDRAVVRSLEQAETASAQGHAPNNVAVARVRGKYAEQEQSAGENRQADTAQYAGVDPFGEYARQWGEDHRGQRPRGQQQPAGDGILTQLALQEKRQRNHGEHLGRERQYRRGDRHRKDRDA